MEYNGVKNKTFTITSSKLRKLQRFLMMCISGPYAILSCQACNGSFLTGLSCQVSILHPGPRLWTPQFPNGAEPSSHPSRFGRPSRMGFGSGLLTHLLWLVTPTSHGSPLVILIMVECKRHSQFKPPSIPATIYHILFKVWKLRFK